MANKHLFALKAAPVAEAMPSAEASKEKPHAQRTAKKKKAQKGEKSEKAQDQPAAVAADKKEKAKGQKQAKQKEGMSMVQAAEKVLAEKGEAMTCRDMVTAMTEKGYWKPRAGLTPHNTLYSAILRLIQRDGKSAAFRKEDRGLFALNASART